MNPNFFNKDTRKANTICNRDQSNSNIDNGNKENIQNDNENCGDRLQDLVTVKNSNVDKTNLNIRGCLRETVNN